MHPPTFSDWRSFVQKSLKQQKKHTIQEFETRLAQVKLQLAEQGFNSELYYNNKVRVRMPPQSCPAADVMIRIG